MVFFRRTELLTYLAVIALMIGCSGNGSQAPLVPDNEPNMTAQNDVVSGNNTYIWEMGEVTIDVESNTVEVVPLRTADFTLNIVKFLQPPAGSTANLTVTLDLPNCDVPNAYIDLDCTLNHPFPGTEFWGFDVRIIVFAGGSIVGKHDPSLRYPAPTELRMVNADGYTRWWNREEFFPTDKIFGYTEGVMAPAFTTTWSRVNGYKYYYQGITAKQMPPNPPEAGRGSFPSGSVTREMLLQFPKVAQPFKFKYSIAASWENPTVNPPTDVSHFPATANCAEAYQVVVTQNPASTAYYENASNFGGDLILDIEVWDWKQGGGTVEDEIAGIWIESPTLLSNQGGVVNISSWATSAGSSPNSIKYSGTLSNLTPTGTTGQDLFVTVESSSPNTYAPPLPTFNYPPAPLAAYHLFVPTILDSGTPPPKSITVTYPNGGEILHIDESDTITWNWTGPIVNVSIHYSTDGGATYPNLIIGSTPCDGSYIWDPIPDTPTTQARIRITEDSPTPEAQDESDADFTITEDISEPGWNPIPGKIAKLVNNPEPNQSTVQPDLGIQNDDAGAEGAWMADQEGSGDEFMMFFDYLLDWSGPGGNAYPSGFNFNFAPFGRHDVSANGVVLFGCSANTNAINPPIINDPVTRIWYISYLLSDEADPGDLYMVSWGDSGTTDPPTNDPDEQPWYHTADVSGGLPGWQGTTLDNVLNFLMCFSTDPNSPPPLPEDVGDLNIGIWAYPYLTAGLIYRLGFPDYTTKPQPPFYQAFDVSDPSKMRIATDTDSYITFGGDYDDLMIGVNMIDSLNHIYCSAFQLDWDASSFGYIGLDNTIKIFKTDPLYVSGGTAIDLEMLPTTTVLYEKDWEQGFNWLAVLFQTSGGWVVRVYEVNWTAESLEEVVSEIETTDEQTGTPLAIDVDPINFHIHVLYKDGSNAIRATVFDYTPG
ncbi:MAG TPA: hypothetical protein ENN67_00255 [Firmicutes bacterium]|nr:hypothetical protein [Bacillota bacterium]